MKQKIVTYKTLLKISLYKEWVKTIKPSSGCQESKLDSIIIISWSPKFLSPSQVSTFLHTSRVYSKINN